jgi:hypothetical protein
MQNISHFPYPFNFAPRPIAERKTFAVSRQLLERVGISVAVLLMHLTERMDSAEIEGENGVRGFLTNIEQIRTALPFLNREDVEEGLEVLSLWAMIVFQRVEDSPGARMILIHVAEGSLQGATADLLHFDGEVARCHGVEAAIVLEKIWETWSGTESEGINSPISMVAVSQQLEPILPKDFVSTKFKAFVEEGYLAEHIRGNLFLTPTAHIGATTGHW